MKNQSNEWFDGELAEQISNRDKLFKKFKRSKLHFDELIYKEAKNTVQRLIKEKKKKFFSKKLEENISEPLSFIALRFKDLSYLVSKTNFSLVKKF